MSPHVRHVFDVTYHTKELKSRDPYLVHLIVTFTLVKGVFSWTLHCKVSTDYNWPGGCMWVNKYKCNNIFIIYIAKSAIKAAWAKKGLQVE